MSTSIPKLQNLHNLSFRELILSNAIDLSFLGPISLILGPYQSPYCRALWPCLPYIYLKSVRTLILTLQENYCPSQFYINLASFGFLKACMVNRETTLIICLNASTTWGWVCRVCLRCMENILRFGRMIHVK